MDTQKIIQTVEDRLGSLQRVNDEIFVVARRHKNRQVASYFFDCSGAPFRKNFNLQEYQEKLLATSYYENPGPLQWNFYLYFVCDDEPFSQFSGTSRLAEIEANPVYARKRVLRQSELGAELDLLIHSDLPAAGGLDGDVANRWRERLKEQKLDAVFLNVPYTRTVESYLSGEPIRDPSETGGTSTCSVADLPQIDALMMHKYRLLPEQREFLFGKANLITGANGTGKTSLLEALELWICGEALRTRGAPDLEPRLGLRFNGEEEFRWNMATMAEYRGRDQVWYGNHYRSGNHLCEGFNRFNLFNSDAAAALVLRDDAAVLCDALSALVLGEEASFLYSRLEALLPRFQQEQRHLTREVRRLRGELKETESQLQAANQVFGKQLEQARDNFLQSLNAISWKGSPPGQDGPIAEHFVAQLNTVAASAEQIRQLIGLFPAGSTLRDVKELQRDAIALCDEWRATEVSFATARLRNSELLDAVREDDKVIRKLQRLQAYTEHSEANSLLGIGDMISAKQRECDQYRSLLATVADISLEPYANNTAEIKEELRSHEERLAKLQNDRDELDRAVRRMQEDHGRFATIVAEIRARATTLISEHPDLRECPICRAQYDIGELAFKLQNEIQEQSDVPGLQAQAKELAVIEDHIEGLKLEQMRLRLLVRAWSLLPDRTLAKTRSLAGLVSRLRASRAAKNALEEEFTRLQVLRDRLGAEAFTEEELRNLRDWSIASFPKLFAEPFDSVRLSGLVNEIEEARRSHLEELAQIQHSLDILAGQRQEIRRKARLDPPPGLDDEAAQELLQRRAGRFTEATGAISRLTEFLFVDSEAGIDAVLHTAAALQFAAEGYGRAVQEAQQNKNKRAAAIEKLSQVKKELAEILQQANRADLAVETLQNIYEKDSKEQNLLAAMRRHSDEITAIFQCLHSPREFKSVSFADVLQLSRASGIAEPLTHISTGQRSALAISIFLAMNRQLPRGPRLLLFDDPVVHIDDLNVLSFLDYLREVTLRGERQVFFTTANRRIANLFEKKFAFLGDDLQIHALERTQRILETAGGNKNSCQS